MSGILDNKRRVLDVFITQEGRRQLALGNFKIESFTFSDSGVRYAPDSVSGSFDATSTVYFEASELPQHAITFESDDDGNLNPFKNGEGLSVVNGQLLSYSDESSTFVTGVDLVSLGTTFLQQTVENFRKLHPLSTRDDLFDVNGFGVGGSNVQFVISNDRPIRKEFYETNLTVEESLFNDQRFANATNFRYLPPINRTDDSIDKTNPESTKNFHLGSYPKLGQTERVTQFSDLAVELSLVESLGYMRTLKFDPTSKQNNLLVQAFERTHERLGKLEIVDFGRFKHGSTDVHVFFVGKLLTDDNDTHTFAHMFTLVFEA